jgi:hypothetical protein
VLKKLIHSLTSIEALLGVLSVTLVKQFVPADSTTSLAMPPLIAAALISAAAAAATGIAGAAAQGDAAKRAGEQSDAQRRLQERLLKHQLAQQQGQFDQTALMNAQQAVGSSIQNQANTTLDRAADRQQARSGLSKALGALLSGN